MSPLASLPSKELAEMVKTLADLKASMPRKLRGVLKKEYGVDVQVDNTLGVINYTAGGGRLMPNLRFTLMANGAFLVRRYKPGDWEPALKRAYDDLVAQSGAFGRLSIKLPEPTSDIGKGARPPKNRQPQKNKGLLDRLLGIFIESED